MPLSPTVGSSCSLRRCDVEDFGPYDDGRHRHLLDGRPGEAFDVKRVQANARRQRAALRPLAPRRYFSTTNPPVA